MNRIRECLDASQPNQQKLIEAARNQSPVEGLTHNFYRYPARFSPQFVRAAIETFSSPGDLVVDPFMGGGTTLVEAIAGGRHALGTDISSLAGFVSLAKTTVYSETELLALSRWEQHACKRINVHKQVSFQSTHDEEHYLRHLDRTTTWRLRKSIQQALVAATELSSNRLETFARCVILRTAQWALDTRKSVPTVSEFRHALSTFTHEMIGGARELRIAVKGSSNAGHPVVHCLTGSNATLHEDPALNALPKPKLILTSPPYPGVHVLYHRWQINGRKETPAPFWIANKLDGAGASYYTMGGRHTEHLDAYFASLRNALEAIAALSSQATTIVQVVAFSDPGWQLSRYLAIADDVGLQEVCLQALKGQADGRLWRTVPNRKWYADQQGATHSSKEVVLFHRKR